MRGPAIPAGARLHLRDVETADVAGPYSRWMRDPDVLRFLESRFTVHTVESLADYVVSMQEAENIRFLAIVLHDGRHIGNMKLGPIEWPHRRSEVAIMVGERDCWGQGYGSEAIGVLSAFAFGELGLEKLTAGAYAPNIGSIRAFQRAGFHIEATRARHYTCDGELVDAVLMARFRAEPQKGTASG